MRKFEASFTAVSRTVLQFEADSPEDAREQVEKYARDGYCDDMAMADDQHPTLVDVELGETDGFVWYQEAFGDKEAWLRATAVALSAEADRLAAGVAT